MTARAAAATSARPWRGERRGACRRAATGDARPGRGAPTGRGAVAARPLAPQPSSRSSSADLAPSVRRADGPIGRLLAAPAPHARAQADKDLADSGTRAIAERGLYDGDLDTRLRKAQK